jgi:hypothetical protein
MRPVLCMVVVCLLLSGVCVCVCVCVCVSPDYFMVWCKYCK